MKTKYLKVLPIIALSLLISIPVLAKNSAPGQALNKSPDEAQAKKDEMQGNKEEKMLQRCEQVQQRVQNRVENFYQNKEEHVANYNSMISKINTINTNLVSQSVNTTQLMSHIEEFQNLANQYGQQYSTFISTLENGSQSVCGESEGQYRNSLGKAKSELNTAQGLRQQLRTYYADVLREDLLDIRESLSSSTSEVTNE